MLFKNVKLLFYYFINMILLVNKTVSFTVITLIAVIIETGTIAPIIAHDVTGTSKNSNGICPPFFVLSSIALGKHPDHNFNGKSCNLTLDIEDRDRRWILDDFVIFNNKGNVS